MPRLPLLPRAAVAACLAALAGCASQAGGDRLFGLVTPYRVDIVQGNVVTREQADAVKPGMTRDEVRDILGSPLVADPFHAQRWDYVFSIRRPGTTPQMRSVVARFDANGRLERLEAAELPSEREFVASITPARRRVEASALQLSDAQRQALPVAVRPTAAPAASAAAATARTYPPLEPQ